MHVTRAADESRFLSATVFDVPFEVLDGIATTVLGRIARMSRSVGFLDLDSIYSTEPPAGGAHRFKLCFFRPANAANTTVMVTNLRDGWVSFAGLLAREHGALQAQVISTQRTAEYPKHCFRTWADGREDRIVQVMRDSDKWQFFERGAPRPFEQTEAYCRRVKKHRLTREMLIAYLQAMGWDADSPDFWRTDRDAIFHQATGPRWN